MSDWLDDEKITLKAKSIDILTNHWIAEGERVATERIIKLLEEARSVFVEDTVSYGTMTGLIALIKGEK